MPGWAFAQPLKSWRLAVISDMNESYGSKTYQPALDVAIADIRASGVDLVLSTGDMVAGQKTGLDYSGMWRAFHSHVTNPLSDSAIPFLPSPGNHDAAIGTKFQQERDHYERTFLTFPIERFNGARAADEQIHFVPGVAQNYPFFYAVKMGPAVFIALDATLPGRLVDGQFEWLQSVLQASASSSVKVVFGHFPLYPFAFQRAHEHLAHGSLTTKFYKRMEDLLETHRVDLYLSGHHHAYYPGRRRGHVRYVSVPLLGTGARALLNSAGDHSVRSSQGFLYVDFNSAGQLSLRSIRSPELTEVSLRDVPSSVSIPRNSSSTCTACSSFPTEFFLNSDQRTVYLRW